MVNHIVKHGQPYLNIINNGQPHHQPKKIMVYPPSTIVNHICYMSNHRQTWSTIIQPSHRETCSTIIKYNKAWSTIKHSHPQLTLGNVTKPLINVTMQHRQLTKGHQLSNQRAPNINQRGCQVVEPIGYALYSFHGA